MIFMLLTAMGNLLISAWITGMFPLLNMELIGISKEDQEKGIRVNDPNNPGRTYISGKGLAFPSVSA